MVFCLSSSHSSKKKTLQKEEDAITANPETYIATETTKATQKEREKIAKRQMGAMQHTMAHGGSDETPETSTNMAAKKPRSDKSEYKKSAGNKSRGKNYK
jgi:hypothetical protein